MLERFRLIDYSRGDEAEARQAKVLTQDEGRRIVVARLLEAAAEAGRQ